MRASGSSLRDPVLVHRGRARRSTTAAVVALAAIVGPATAFPQDVYVTLVHAHFTVTDSHGRLVTTLGRDDVERVRQRRAKTGSRFQRSD